MALKFVIAGVDRTNYYKAQTLRINDEVGKRSEADFILRSNDGFVVKDGQKIEIYDDADIVFNGVIINPREKSFEAGAWVFISVSAQDYQAVCDRRVVNDSYDNLTAGAIVQDIITTVLASEGIAAGTIHTGVTLPRAVFPLISATQAIDELSEASGYTWWVDSLKKLHFVERGAFLASWNITTTSKPVRDVSVEHNRDGYRNRQYIRAGNKLSDLRTEKFTGDGKIKTFVLSLPVAKEPEDISVNGVSLGKPRYGVRGRTNNMDYYYARGETIISQDDALTPLTSTDELSVTYFGYYPILVVAEQSDEISRRQALEGGTGLYEAVDNKKEIDNSEAALAFAQGKLKKYAKITKVLTYNTDIQGLRAGMLQEVTLPEHELQTVKFFIQSSSLQDLGPSRLRYYVRAVDGDFVGGWDNFFKKIAKTTNTPTIRENEILVKMKTAKDRVAARESLTISKAAPESRIGYARIGFSEVK
jgi:hypothetical protein